MAFQDSFKGLTDFSKYRSGKEALVFYVVYTLAMLVTIAVLAAFAGILGLLGHADDRMLDNGQILGLLVAISFSAGLSFLVIDKKNIKTPKNFAFVILAGVLCFLSGLLGMAVPAWLTTRAVNRNA